MKLCIDISQIVYKGSGVGRFTEGLTSSICKYEKDHTWTFFFSSLRQSLDPAVKQMIESSNHRLVELRFPPSALSLLWNSLHTFPITMMTGAVDWTITSDWTEPPSDSKKATIVHDLTYLRYPETVDQRIKNTQEKRMRWVKKESDVIFADSVSTKNDLIELLKIDTQRIQVNYPGISPVLSSTLQTEIKRPFILTVGKREPRKNLGRLIDAFVKLNRPDIDLYIAGMEGWGDVKIPQKENIKLLGYVSDLELSRLYQSCLFFVFPSLFEGFGYPVLEAMSYGAPVATSDSSSLKEIADNAALLFDPVNSGSIASTLKQFINSEKLRKELSQKGLKRAKKFTWKNYYELFIKTLESHT